MIAKIEKKFPIQRLMEINFLSYLSLPLSYGMVSHYVPFRPEEEHDPD
jgi:hypothetical protein